MKQHIQQIQIIDKVKILFLKDLFTQIFDIIRKYLTQ